MNKERTILRYVAVRTSDDTAVVQDLPKGRAQLTHAFPLMPTFDALGYFTLTGIVRMHDSLEAYGHDYQPLSYPDAPTQQPQAGGTDENGKHVDVVVARLLAYSVEYADDSSAAPNGHTHLKLRPYRFVTDKATKDNFFFDDVVIDNTTNLPSHVSFTGPDGLAFSVDYGTVSGNWVVTHAHYEETVFGPLRIGRAHSIVDADFDQFTFPSAPPDPQLAK